MRRPDRMMGIQLTATLGGVASIEP